VFGAAKQMLKAGMLTCDILLFVGTCRHFGGTYLSNCMTSPSICIILIIYSILLLLIYIFKDCTLTRPSRPVVVYVFETHNHINSSSRHVLIMSYS